jgi:type I restriction enzyme R subunit
MLETVRRRLRALVKLIEHKQRILVYSDFEDRAGAKAEIIVPGMAIGTDMDAFRRKARVFLKPYEDHIAVLKLKRNEPLTATDLKELERIFMEAGVDEASLAKLQKIDGAPAFRSQPPRSRSPSR